MTDTPTNIQSKEPEIENESEIENEPEIEKANRFDNEVNRTKYEENETHVIGDSFENDKSRNLFESRDSQIFEETNQDDEAELLVEPEVMAVEAHLNHVTPYPSSIIDLVQPSLQPASSTQSSSTHATLSQPPTLKTIPQEDENEIENKFDIPSQVQSPEVKPEISNSSEQITENEESGESFKFDFSLDPSQNSTLLIVEDLKFSINSTNNSVNLSVSEPILDIQSQIDKVSHIQRP